MIHKTILIIIIAFAISALLHPIIIPFLHKLKFGQQVRGGGSESHLEKQGALTIGGLVILSSIIIISIFYIPSYPKIIPALLVTVGFGIIGFLDNYIKIVMRHFEGLKPMQELVDQSIITGTFAWYLLDSGEAGTDVLTPFTGGSDGSSFLSLGIFFVPAPFFIVLGMDNGVNFTDGLDDPCISVTILAVTSLAIMAIGEDMGISPVTGAVVGSLLGLLLFNIHPARVFMRDTDSLVLGGFMVASCYMMRMLLFIPVIGPIYLAEVLSAIIQVTYFKYTGGKRIFKMASIHHHSELCGWPETRAVAVFAIATAILCVVAYLELQISVSHARDQRTAFKRS